MRAPRAYLALALAASAAACSTDDPPQDAPPPPAAATILEVPDPSWADAPADHTFDGVEVMDPQSVLTTVSAESLAPTDALPEVMATVSLEPSGALAAPVYLRIALAEAQVPGTRLLLFTRDDETDSPGGRGDWYPQAEGVVLEDGATALVAVRHFSVHSLVAEVDEKSARAAFAAGAANCTGVPHNGAVLANREQYCRTDGTSEAMCSTRGAKLDAASARTTLVDVTVPGVFFKNEECTRTSTKGPGRSCFTDFEGPRHCAWYGEDELGTPAVKDRLRRLQALVDAASCGTLAVRVTETFDSGGPTCRDGEHKPTSLHYTGRAVDLTVTQRTCTAWDPATATCSAQGFSTSTHYPEGLGRLGRLATQAGFDWVEFEGNHIHASVRPEGAGPVAAANELVMTVEIDDETTEIRTGSLRPLGAGPGLALESRPVVGEGWWRLRLDTPERFGAGLYTVGAAGVGAGLETEDRIFEMAESGFIEIQQVPEADKNVITTFEGRFELVLRSGTGGRATLRGAWSFPDAGFW